MSFENINFNTNEMNVNSYSLPLFLFGIRSPKTKEKLIGRLVIFLNFLDINGEKGSIQKGVIFNSGN